jgi:hypothetical protein
MVPDPRGRCCPAEDGRRCRGVPSAWIEWIGQAARASASLSQELVLQAAEWQRQFAADAVQGWMEHNTRLMKIGIHVAQAGLRLSPNRFSD